MTRLWSSADWTVGTRLEHVETGKLREIVRITPAGAAGTRVSDGPVWHAAIVGPDGTVRPGGHVVDIWSRSLSNPSADWTLPTAPGTMIPRPDITVGMRVECPRRSSVGAHDARVTHVDTVGTGTPRTIVTLDCGHDVNMSDGHGLYSAP